MWKTWKIMMLIHYMLNLTIFSHEILYNIFSSQPILMKLLAHIGHGKYQLKTSKT